MDIADATAKASISSSTTSGMPKAKKAKRIDVMKAKEHELNVAVKKMTRKMKKHPTKQAKTSSTVATGLVSVGYASDSSSS